MKYVACAIALMMSSAVMASGFVNGESSIYTSDNGGKPYTQITISGASAEALYKSLTVQANDLTDEHGGGAYGSYKNGKDISCTQTYGHYSCSLFVDAAGQILK